VIHIYFFFLADKKKTMQQTKIDAILQHTDLETWKEKGFIKFLPDLLVV